MIDINLIDEIYEAIVAIRNAVNRPIIGSNRWRSDNKYREDIKQIVMNIEGIRIDLQFARKFPDESTKLLNNVFDIVIKLQNEPALESFLDVRTRGMIPSRDRVRHLIPELGSGELRLGELLHILPDRITHLLVESLLDETTNRGVANGARALRRIVPQQKLAPAQFDIINDQLVLANLPVQLRADDITNVQQARTALMARGENIIKALERSNCDKRVLNSVQELQEGLTKESNAIELGLMNIGVDQVCKSAAAELPEALLGEISGYVTGVAMFVAQFEEWRRFSENAASVDITTDDIEKIGAAAQSIIDRLDEHPGIAAAEVPKTLRALRALVSNPPLASKRAAFAVLRTIENLVARVYQYGADFLDKTAQKTVDKLSSKASTTIVVILMTAALTATATMGGVPAKVAETNWMKTASEIVKKQIEDMQKGQ
jgi:hypothetical protein